ncbi:hyalin-like [Ptychodera flava]|uniref:hyalin-like n=1 Tax=Ptychodera flava TaxID=63121 RepID=UPI003969E016
MGPLVSCPSNITVQNEYGNVTAVVAFDGESATDNSGQDVTVTCDPPSNSTFVIGDNVVTCSATDASGNVGTCSFTVTVEDNISPHVTCPSNVTVEYDYGNTTAVVVFSGESAIDNAGHQLGVTCDPRSNSTFGKGDTVVTCSATDRAGNVGVCEFIVTVQDTTSPMVMCPSNVFAENDYGNTTAVVVFGGEYKEPNSNVSSECLY